MTDEPWGRRAADMRLWAMEVRDPYTRIEMIALADIYQRRAERWRVAPPHAIKVKSVSKLMRARCGRRIEPDWRMGRSYS